MRKFFDINVPFNRLQFNICLLIVLGLLLFDFFYNISLFYFNYVMSEIYIGLCLLIFLFALYKRLKDLNWTNKYLFEALFIPSLFYTSWLYFRNHELYHVEISEVLPAVVGIFCIYLSIIFMIYYSCFAIFVKGNNQNLENYCYKPKFMNIFNIKFFKNWVDFKSKAQRNEFFLCGIFCLILLLIYKLICIFILGKYFLEMGWLPDYETKWIRGIFIGAFIALILTLSMFIRRLRDIGLSLWHYILIFFFPVNVLLFMVLMFGKSEEPAENKKTSQ